MSVPLLKHAYEKLKSDNVFMAYYLHEYATEGGYTIDQMIVLVGADNEECFYKLALCKAPLFTTLSLTDEEILEKMKKICSYANCKSFLTIFSMIRSIIEKDKLKGLN